MISGFRLRDRDMIELCKENVQTNYRHSSKGNQLKWTDGNYWYKADYTGYEGLSEYVISSLLKYSSLKPEEYVLYETEEIKYGEQIYRGCKSRNFLEKGWQLITLERLFQAEFGESLYKSIYRIGDYQERFCFLVEQTKRLTGIKDFGKYMCKLLTVDAIFLNEDRHTHNIAVLWDGDREFAYCPIFDQGAALLADTIMDYPMNQTVLKLMEKTEAKTFCSSFEEQLDIAEELYGEQIHFHFGESEIKKILQTDRIYSGEEKDRVYTILLQQRRKYQYLFP